MTGEADPPMSTEDRLVYMANQIARNFAAMGQEQAAKATAEHITSFWDPRMRTRISAILADRPGLFSAIATAAIQRLQARRGGAVDATDESGRSGAA